MPHERGYQKSANKVSPFILNFRMTDSIKQIAIQHIGIVSVVLYTLNYCNFEIK